MHKTTFNILILLYVQRGLFYALEQGMPYAGASISDYESARLVCENSLFSLIQLPFNTDPSNHHYAEVIDLARSNGKVVVTNRPFDMGSILYDSKGEINTENKEELMVDAYRHIIRHGAKVILTGAASETHLRQNLRAFHKALKE